MLQGLKHEIKFTGRKDKEARKNFTIVKIANNISNAFKNFKLYIPTAALSQKIPSEENQQRAIRLLEGVFQAAIEVIKKQNANPIGFQYMELISVTPFYTPMAQSAAQPSSSSEPSSAVPSSAPAPLYDDSDDDLGGISSCSLL